MNIIELSKEIEKIIENEYELIEEYYGDPDCDCVSEAKDSFGVISLTGYSCPEDAIWDRDLQDNFYAGIELAVRNTLKVLSENPDILNKLNGECE